MTLPELLNLARMSVIESLCSSPPPHPLNLHKSDQHNLHLPSQVPNQGIELPGEVKMRKDLVVEDEEPVVEPVGDVQEEEADEDEAEAEHQQLHPCLVLKVELSVKVVMILSLINDHVCGYD